MAATTVGIRCTNCNAHVEREGSRFCSFCGGKLPVVPIGGGPVTLPADALAARFEVLMHHESLPTLMEYEPALPTARKPPNPAVIAVIVTAAFFFVGLTGVATFYQDNPGMAAFIAAALIPATAVVFQIVKRSSTVSPTRSRRRRVHKHPVLVADERTKVTGGGNVAARTQYFVTLQSREGERSEYHVEEALAAYVSRGDMGVAYIHRGSLMSFRRITI